MKTDPGNIKIANRLINVGVGTGAAQFPEKEYINGIFVAVYSAAKTHSMIIVVPSIAKSIIKMTTWKSTALEDFLADEYFHSSWLLRLRHFQLGVFS
jgi:hypothetical protein